MSKSAVSPPPYGCWPVRSRPGPPTVVESAGFETTRRTCVGIGRVVEHEAVMTRDGRGRGNRSPGGIRVSPSMSAGTRALRIEGGWRWLLSYSRVQYPARHGFSARPVRWRSRGVVSSHRSDVARKRLQHVRYPVRPSERSRCTRAWLFGDRTGIDGLTDADLSWMLRRQRGWSSSEHQQIGPVSGDPGASITRRGRGSRGGSSHSDRWPVPQPGRA